MVSAEAQAALEEYAEYVSSGFTPLPIPLVKAKNATVWDIDGNSYIDFLSFFAVVNMGHSHPKIVDAACKAIQDRALINTGYVSPSYGKLAAKIHDLLGYSRTVGMCSGADATDSATKIARKWGYLKKGIPKDQAFVLTASECYHGMTISTHSLASQKETYFGPYVTHVGPVSPSGVEVEYGDIESLKAAIEADHETICAFMVEPIQGSAGIIDPPKGYLKQAFDLCKKYNILFIADEVQTGLGRTGYLLHSFSEDIKPDLLCLGKALGGGVAPLSAVCGSPEVMDLLAYGDVGSTMACNPPATEAAIAALDVLIDEKIPEMSKEKGILLRKLIKEEKLEAILSVSGQGCLAAAVLNPEMVDEKFNGRRLAAFCAQNGVLVGSAGGGKRVRICPPPTIEIADLEKGVKIFADCVRKLRSIEGPILGVA